MFEIFINKINHNKIYDSFLKKLNKINSQIKINKKSITKTI
jgi:hypothetical protein